MGLALLPPSKGLDRLASTSLSTGGFDRLASTSLSTGGFDRLSPPNGFSGFGEAYWVQP